MDLERRVERLEEREGLPYRPRAGVEDLDDAELLAVLGRTPEDPPTDAELRAIAEAGTP